MPSNVTAVTAATLGAGGMAHFLRAPDIRDRIAGTCMTRCRAAWPISWFLDVRARGAYADRGIVAGGAVSLPHAET